MDRDVTDYQPSQGERAAAPSSGALVRSQEMRTGGAIAPLIPQSFESVQRLARMILESGFAPKDSTQISVAGAILKGLEVGVPPMQAVQGIAVINGRPAIWGDLMIAIVQRSPVCEEIDEWIEGEGDDMVAHCRAVRVGRAKPIERTFSVADAKKARLWQTQDRVTRHSKGGGSYEKENDSPWFRFPKRMLQMRARSLCLRDGFADVLAGLEAREVIEDEQREERAARPAENPLIDPPQEALIDAVFEEVDDEPAASAALADPEDSLDPLDAQPIPITIGGMTINPPSDEFSVVDFAAFLGSIKSASEGEVNEAARKAKALVDSLPEDHRPIYRIAVGVRKAQLKGIQDDDPSAFANLSAWVASGFTVVAP